MSGTGGYGDSRHNSGKDQSDLRRPSSLDSTKSMGSPSPRGPRPLKHSPTSEKGPIQIMKSATDPISGYYGANERWTNTEAVTSQPEYAFDPQDNSVPSFKPVRQAAFEPMRSGTPTSVASAPVPSAKLWDNLRHHVLTVRPSTPSQPTARSGTPKFARLQKLGLRQLVEDVATMEVGMRKFAEDILRACNIARYGEIQKPSREREGSSSSQLANSNGRRLDYLRRPLSTASISSSTQASSPPSLRYLYQMLVHYSTNLNTDQNSVQLPYEIRVLSTLLCPFLSRTNYPISRLEEEQLTAMDAFELLSNSWAPDEVVLTDRLLWCAKAAATMPPHPARTRLLSSLRKQLIPPSEGPGLRLSAQSFRCLTSNLFLLLASLHIFSASHPNVDQHQAPPSQNGSPASTDLHLVQDSINKVLSGSIEVEEQSIIEEYGATSSSTNIKRALSIEALLHCIENSSGPGGWILQNTFDQYWPSPSDQKFAKLQAIFCSRRLEAFCRISQTFLQSLLNISSKEPPPKRPLSSATSSSSLDTAGDLSDSRHLPRLVFILKTRVLPEAEILSRAGLDDQIMSKLRTHIARLLLDLIRLNVDGLLWSSTPKDDVFGGRTLANAPNWMELVKWAVQVLAGWYRAGTGLPWRAVLEGTLQQLTQGEWQTSVPVLLSLLRHMPEDIKKSIISTIIPLFNDQLVNDPPPYPYPEMSAFLSSLSRTWPPLFYKPLFACAASDKEVIVVNHLCTIQIHAKYVQDYWTRDTEMLCVALLSDIGMTDTGSGNDKWAKARLGQLVLLVELIGRIQKLRHEKENSSTESDSNFSSVSRFVSALETQLWKMMVAKENKSFIPPSQRMLLCILLREFRLMTRSLKPAQWLSTTLKWFDDFCADEHLGELDQEVTESVQRVQGLYMAGQSGVQQIHKRHTSMFAKSFLKAGSEKSTDVLDLALTFVEHRKLIDSLSKGYIPRAVKLFVTLSLLISTEDYRRLGTTLWRHCLLDNVDTPASASACFLLMRCAEKTPMDILPAIEVDLHASDDITRLEAVRKIAVLVNWRYQISTQNFLTDRTHRPFKLGRPPLPFVATDLGSSLYVPVEEVKQNRDKGDVPLELRKRLEELGWIEDDAKPIDPRQEVIQAPLSILPLDHLDRMEVGTGEVFAASTSPLPTPQPSPRRNQTQQTLPTVDDTATLLRRNSSSGGPIGGMKRRAVFVPTLSSIFEHLSRLVFDTNLSIASAARTTLLDIMRSDPSLLARTVLDQLAGDNKDIRFAVSTFSALLHVRHILPPPLAYYLFNNLAGFLKYVMKHIPPSEALSDFGQVMPVLTSLAVQVSGLSMRGIRRSKMEHTFTPSGSLWFSSEAPKSAMFPRMLEDSNFPSQSVPPHLFSISMVRASQNLFFLTLLKRNYKDVQAIRKSISTLVLPSALDSGSKSLELRHFVPGNISSQMVQPKQIGIDMLSLMVARSHILLVTQIFRSLPRHLSDRSELAILVDGLNRCLLAHGDDISIVSHVLIALMVASARFRRLFLMGAGYTLFMPALVKVYTEQPAHLGIRSALEYAISRFYVLHKEAFLYQSIHIIGQIAMLPEIEAASFSKGVFDMFASLRKSATLSSVDVAGIHGVNEAEEREAYLFHTADETPQTLLSSIRRKESSQSGLHMILQLPHDYGEARLNMDDFVRLLLTVIAHDLTISRAQHFLRLLRYISPYLYNASGSTRAILADGIVALGTIFTKAFSKPKGGEFPKPLAEQKDESVFAAGPGLEKLVNETTRSPSESKTMRMDFLYLVLAFGQAGGMVSPLLASQAIDVTRSLLKDCSESGFHDMAAYLNDFVKMLFIREEPLGVNGVVGVLHRLAPIFHAFMMVDFTGVFETILRILPIPVYAHDTAFSHVIVEDICSAGLAACDLAASEDRLMDLPYRSTFVCLMAEVVFLRDVDIIGELLKRRPTNQFLAGIILPLVLVMKTGAQIIPDSTRTDFHRRMLTNAWIRLLFYSISACQESQRDGGGAVGSAGSVRSKSSDSRTQEGSSQKSHLSILAIGLQVIKVIIVRGADDISSVTRLGVWERVASFLQVTLVEGNADFALKPEPSSTATTPTGSPRSSTQFENLGSNSGYNLFVSTSSSLNPTGSSPSLPHDHPKPFAHPRLIDYCLWSMLEFVCAYRSPLRMHLKLLATEKVLAIHQELRQGTRSRASFSRSPSTRRVSASIGLRARHRASSRDGPTPSPDSSPYLHPSQSNLSPSSTHLSASPSRLSPSPTTNLALPPALDIPATNVRRPGYAISPIIPPDRAPNWPKIVHLGPTSPTAFLAAPSPSVGSGLRRFSRAGYSKAGSPTLSHSAAIRSDPLSQATFRRIRGVQAYLGYRTLLPLPSSRYQSEIDDDEDAFLLTWTRSRALTSIVQETNALLEEFENSSQNEKSFDIEPSTPTPITGAF